MDGDASRRAKLSALLRFSLKRARRQLRTAPRQTAALVGIVALTIALLLVVTGIGVALAEEPSANTDADFRITPTDGTTLSAVVDVEGPRLTDAHDRAADIESRDDVEYATPVMAEPIEMRTTQGTDTVTVVALGVATGDYAPSIVGISTSHLESEDPHYADGAYDGDRTGDVLLSTTAADQLGAEEGDPLLVRAASTGAVSQSHEVTAVESADSTDTPGQFPIAVVQLSELQSLSGATDDDLADQVLVGTDAGAETTETKAALEEAYPDASVESTGGNDGSLTDDNLALATSLVALVVGLTVCALSVTTVAALFVERDRRTIAVLAAVGFSRRARLGVIVLTTLLFILAGGVLGLVAGTVGIVLVNVVASATVAPGSIAVIRPAFVPYGLVVALVAGLLALPYPLALAARTNVIEELKH